MPLSIRVQGMKLLPQDGDNACWYASTMMMYRWYKARGGTSPDPSTNEEIKNLHKSDNALPWAQMKLYAQMVGMKPKPLMTPSLDELYAWLYAGPLWTDGVPVDWSGKISGTGHVVVLAGLREVAKGGGYQVYVYDPWPPGRGHEGWRPISHLVSILTAGADAQRDVTFLSY